MTHTKLACNALLATLLFSALLPMTAVNAQQNPPAPVGQDTSDKQDAQAADDDNGTRYFVFKLQSTYFMPKSAETREVFGDVWQETGLAVALLQKQLCPKHQIALRTDPILRDVGDNHAYLIPLGVQYTGYFGPAKPVQPYWLISADAVLIDLEVADRNINESQISFGASAGIGARVGKYGFVQLTYQTTSHVEEFDLCGAKFAAGVSF